MLIKCPRCGFSQPEDQYCASCGVNIETYVPRKSSLSKRVFSSTLLQVAFVISATLGVSYYGLKAKDSLTAQSPRRKNIQQTITHASLSQETSSAPSNSQLQSESTQNINNDQSVTVELQNEEQRSRLAGTASDVSLSDHAASSKSTNPSNKQNGVASNSTLTTTTAAGAAAEIPSIQLKVSYYEISRDILNFWIQNSRIHSESDTPFSIGLVNRKLFEDQIRYSALKSESTKVSINLKTYFRSDANKDGIAIGLNTEILMSQLGNGRIAGSLSITKTTAQGGDGLRTYFDIPKDNVFFLHWQNDLLGLQNEPLLLSIPPFQILKSRQYLDKKTELVMIIDSLN